MGPYIVPDTAAELTGLLRWEVVKGRPCSRCKKTPRLSYHSLCRDCKRASVNRWRKANVEKYREYQREYHRNRRSRATPTAW